MDHQPQGFECTLGMAVEDAFGVLKAPTQWWPARSTIKADPGIENLDLAVGDYEETHTTLRGFKAGGGLEMGVFPGRCRELARLFDFRSLPYLNSASVREQHNPQFVKAHTGLVIASATFKADVEGDLTCSLQVNGRNSGAGVYATPNYVAIPSPFIFEEIVVRRDGTIIEYCRSIEITIEHVLRTDKYGSDGTRLLRAIPLRRRRVKVKLGLDFEDPSWYTDFLARTPRELSIVATRGTYAIGWSFPQCITQADADPDQPDIESETMLNPSFEAKKLGAAAAMTMTVTGEG